MCTQCIEIPDISLIIPVSVHGVSFSLAENIVSFSLAVNIVSFSLAENIVSFSLDEDIYFI